MSLHFDVENLTTCSALVLRFYYFASKIASYCNFLRRVVKIFILSPEVIPVIGERLAEIRKDHGDTQQTLAEKLSVSKYTVSNWEQEKSAPDHDTFVRICKLYHVSSDYLLGLSNLDPAYAQHRVSSLSMEDQSLLKDMEAFLIWRSHNR